jgi:hypothetical protein
MENKLFQQGTDVLDTEESLRKRIEELEKMVANGELTSPGQTLPGVMIKNKKVVNLTKHDINLKIDDEVFTFPASGQEARIVYNRNNVENPLEAVGYLLRAPRIVGLPETETPGIIYLVSPMVRTQLTQDGEDRPDVYSPYALTTTPIKGRKAICATALAR